MQAYKQVLFALATGAGLALATAASADRDDVRRLAETQVTLIQAIEIAESHQGGRAYEAKLDDDSFSPEYEIDLVIEDLFFEVTVDGVTGEVRKVKEDHDD